MVRVRVMVLRLGLGLWLGDTAAPSILPLRLSLLFALLSIVVELARIVANENVICRCGKIGTLKRISGVFYLSVNR